MDITRNWRLKKTRTQLLATRCPITGEVLLPQQSGRTVNGAQAELYVFDVDEPHAQFSEAEYARAAG